MMIYTHHIFTNSTFLFDKLENLYWSVNTPIVDREKALDKPYTKKDLERKYM